MSSSIVLSKTLTGYTPEDIDEKSNQFRNEHDCIATTASAVMFSGRITYIQTIFYKP